MENEMKIKIYMKNKGKLLANATLYLDTEYGPLAIKNFCIWKSPIFNSRLQEEVNITPPGYLLYGRHKPYVFFEKLGAWENIEEAIYSKFNLERLKGGDESVNPDDIPL